MILSQKSGQSSVRNQLIKVDNFISKKKNLPQYPQCSQQHYLQLPRYGRNLSCPSTDEWIKKWYIYTMEYYAAIKRWNFAICSNMDGLGRAKWIKLDRERQVSTIYGI